MPQRTAILASPANRKLSVNARVGSGRGSLVGLFGKMTTRRVMDDLTACAYQSATCFCDVRLSRQLLSIVHIFLSGQASVNGLSRQIGERQLSVFAPPALEFRPRFQSHPAPVVLGCMI